MGEQTEPQGIFEYRRLWLEAKRRIEELEDEIGNAIEMVEHWGSYAGDYFAEKWDLAGDVKRLREAARDG